MSKKSEPKPQSGQRAEQRLQLRVISVAPPEPKRYRAVYGLQDNSTAAEWVIHGGKEQPGGDIVFDCECRVRAHPRTGAPSFLGPFVHGDAAQRFLYLSWRPEGWRPGDADPPPPGWIRRLKVHLSTITWAQIEEAVRTGGVIEARVRGTSRNGGPSCASVPLADRGWRVRKK